MYRPARQIADEITALQARILVMDKNNMFRTDWTVGQHILHWLEHLEELTKVKDGDEATGAEILAGMPGHEKILDRIYDLDEHLCPKDIGIEYGWCDDKSCDAEKECCACWLAMGMRRFKRKSGTWVPVGEE